QFVGLDNFIKVLTDDPRFWQSLWVTVYFGVLYVPLSLIVGFGLAMLMNQQLRGMRIFRTIYYLPSVLSGVAVVLLWAIIFHREYGLLNWMLGLVGVGPVPWLTSPQWVVPALVIMSLWAVGSSVIVYLGGLQGIPTEYYEAARIDGAGWWSTLRHVTIPLMTP